MQYVNPNIPRKESPRLVIKICILIGCQLFLQTCFATIPTINKAHTPPLSTLIEPLNRLFTTKDELHAASYRVEGRADIKSFAYDLGGSTCACQLQWDRTQYWQRFFYGFRYISAHCVGSFFVFLCFRRFLWVIAWFVFNELREELSLGVIGKWALFDSPFDLEPRYDSITSDILFAIVPSCILCAHVAFVLCIKDKIPDVLHYDMESARRILVPLLEAWLATSICDVFTIFGNDDFVLLRVTFRTGKLVVCVLHVLFLALLVRLHDLERAVYAKLSFLVCLLWAPFVIADSAQPHEQIRGLLAFSLTGLVVSVYHAMFENTRVVELCIVTALYLAVFCAWAFFASIVSEPEDPFYAHRKWCGVSAYTETYTDSCALVRASGAS